MFLNIILDLINLTYLWRIYKSFCVRGTLFFLWSAVGICFFNLLKKKKSFYFSICPVVLYPPKTDDDLSLKKLQIYCGHVIFSKSTLLQGASERPIKQLTSAQWDTEFFKLFSFL